MQCAEEKGPLLVSLPFLFYLERQQKIDRVMRSTIRAGIFRTAPSGFRSASNGCVSLGVRAFSTDTSKIQGLGVGKLNHVAIAVPDLQQASSLYRDVMGAQVSEPANLKEHGVTTVFVNLGNTKLELLHPLGENSPIANFLQKKPGGGIHHICLEVENIHDALKVLQQKGVKVIDPTPKIGAHGKPVVFLHPKDMNGVLVELEQV